MFQSSVNLRSSCVLIFSRQVAYCSFNRSEHIFRGYDVWRDCKIQRVSMGLTINRKTAKNLAVRRKNELRPNSLRSNERKLFTT